MLKKVDVSSALQKIVAILVKAKEWLHAIGVIAVITTLCGVYLRSEAVNYQQKESLIREMKHNISILSDENEYTFNVCSKKHRVQLKIMQTIAIDSVIFNGTFVGIFDIAINMLTGRPNEKTDMIMKIKSEIIIYNKFFDVFLDAYYLSLKLNCNGGKSNINNDDLSNFKILLMM
jgi:predicted nucleic acid-binding protein